MVKIDHTTPTDPKKCSGAKKPTPGEKEKEKPGAGTDGDGRCGVFI